MQAGVREPCWTLVIARSPTFGVRLVFNSSRDATPFAAWIAANGWQVEVRELPDPDAITRAPSEFDTAARLRAAHERWVAVATR